MNTASQTVLILASVIASASAIEITIPWQHGDTFDDTAQRLTFTNSSTGLYRAGRRVEIRNAARSPISVYDRFGKNLYSGPARATIWPPGYYFVESQNDRTAFAVLPAGYRGVPHLGADAEGPKARNYSRNALAAGVGWVREFAYWSHLTTNTMTWRQYDFTMVDRDLDLAAATHTKLFLQLSFWPKYITNAADKTLGRYAEYVNDVTRHVARHRHGSCCRAVALANEPTWNSGQLRSDVPDARQRARFGWNVTWKGDYNEWLAAMYRICAPIIKSNLPNAYVVAGNHNDFGHAFSSLEKVKRDGGLVPEIDAIGFHVYDTVGRVDEPIFARLDFDGKLQIMRSFFPPNAQLFIDEYAVQGSRRAPRARADVLGIPYKYKGSAQEQHRGYDYPGWYDGFCDEIKKSVILKKHKAVTIAHNGFRGSHDINIWNGDYDGWFPGSGGHLRGPRPGLAAWLATNHWLVNARFVANRVENGVSVYEFRRPGGTSLLFAWCVRGKTAELATPRGLRRTDVFGKECRDTTVTAEPCLFHGLPRI